MAERVGVGIVGCGSISGIYLKNLTGMFSGYVRVFAVADLIHEKAVRAQEAYGIPEILTLEQMLARPEIELILNITEPYNHAKVSCAAAAAGKHVYSEKPLGITREEGDAILAAARAGGVCVGGAPDTFLGGGIQTCKKLIDDGWIGKPLSANAFMLGHGPERWHPNPDFFYQKGGGPMFDMGPYYLTALCHLLGPIAAVSGMTSRGMERRMATSKQHYGRWLDVEIPTHITGSLRFASGAVGTMATSFDVWDTKARHIEIHGTLGSLLVPDPNLFGGPIYYTRGGDERKEMPVAFGYRENSRGLGLADMAAALRAGRPARAASRMTAHVLDAMVAFHESADQGKEIALRPTEGLSDPLPYGLAEGVL